MNRGKKVLSAAFFFIAGSGTPAFAQFGITPAPAQSMSSERVLSSGSGRYVFGQISDSSKDQYMLDTSSGRLWRIGESSSGSYLKAIPYRDEQGKFSFVPDGAPEAKPSETKAKEAPRK